MGVCADWLKMFVTEVPIRQYLRRRSVWRHPDDRRGSVDRIKRISACLARHDVSGHLKFWRARHGGTGIATSASVPLSRSARQCGTMQHDHPHEATYWSDRETVTIVKQRAALRDEGRFHAEEQIVVFRMHDHMHAQRPDFTYVRLRARGRPRPKYETAPHSHRVVVPETTGSAGRPGESADGSARAASRGRSPTQVSRISSALLRHSRKPQPGGRRGHQRRTTGE